MTWIRVIDEEEAGGDLREAYREAGAERGRVANILKAHSLSPAAMRAHLALYRELMFGRSELSRAEREMIAVAVSVVNRCHY
ncbi:MAG: carboxymuconolactone decarboxylase family protein [Acidobacteria bacterium]|nr:carboxymuconolactone decarboxylase family protein [Acidobacteriota bacterium]